MAVPCKTVNLRMRHAMQSGNSKRQWTTFRQPLPVGKTVLSFTRHQAKVLTDFGLEEAAPAARGFAVKPWHTRPSMRSTSIEGRALDLKPSSLQA